MSQEPTHPPNSDTNAQPIPSSTTAAANALGLATSAPAESADSSDNDTSEFNRITDLLQSRGLPSHIVNAFGSKVQQLIHRTMSSGITSRSQQLINSLQSADESLKLTALTELCQLLVMGNEDTLVGFPIKQAVPLLLACMSSDSENFDLMNHACRALTYMMDSLPRSSSIIAEGIGLFLDKLQVIQCMDVAEQALTSLEILSRKHSKQILNATQSGSISACLTYIDFFSIAAQRKALQITANCCQNMVKDEFVHIQSSLPILSQRLTHADKKSVESVCTVFSRLVENFQREPSIMKEIASHNVLTNMQQLLVLQPAIVSSSMFVTILHTIYLMCSNCNELSVQLLEHNIAETLKYLLVGSKTPASSSSSAKPSSIDILSVRTPQELYEIVSIIGEMMPRLPHTGVFGIDEILRQTSITHQNEHVAWQWKDEHEVWRPYTAIDSRIIELAFVQEEDECVLNTMGRTYVLDFNSMLQINEETGTARQVARKVLANAGNNNNNNNNSEAVANRNLTAAAESDTSDVDHRLDSLSKKAAAYAEFVETLFPILYEVYSSSAGPSIKHRSLRTLLRIIYHSSSLRTRCQKGEKAEEELLLFDLLKNLPISSHIASMLASNDTKITVSALQTAEILMQQLPDIFAVYFHREGVIYQIDKLIEAKSSSQAAKQPEPVEMQVGVIIIKIFDSSFF
jgi:E3 ubiquitin-protein ligase TRIP12